jgi:steroid 5-alpha reductase family enzyme
VTELAGLALWAVALAGESVADAQLARFKRDPANRGQVCRTGLWGRSRHPNYFFEWLLWCAFALMATGTPWGWVSWSAPALMLYFLLRVTGIPLTEKQAVASKGDAYRTYQREVSAFVPW